jgi:hypothetical protein
VQDPLEDQFDNLIHSDYIPGLEFQIARFCLGILEPLLGLSFRFRNTVDQSIFLLLVKKSALLNQQSIGLRLCLIKNCGRLLFRRSDHTFCSAA